MPIISSVQRDIISTLRSFFDAILFARDYLPREPPLRDPPPPAEPLNPPLRLLLPELNDEPELIDELRLLLELEFELYEVVLRLVVDLLLSLFCVLLFARELLINAELLRPTLCDVRVDTLPLRLLLLWPRLVATCCCCCCKMALLTVPRRVDDPYAEPLFGER